MPGSEKNKPEGAEQTIIIKPVGFVRNSRRNTNWDAGFQAMTWKEKAALMKTQSQAVSEIVINDELEGALDGIDEFSHLLILYWAHRAPDDKRTIIKVHPLGSRELPLVGVFSTHSPARPNSILATVVELLSREGNTLKVTGLDALDGSPVLDIKPYNKDNIQNLRVPEWMKKVHGEFSSDNNSNTNTSNDKGR